MTTKSLPEELEQALEDVRQVRRTVDRLRSSHPVREMLRPMSRFGFWLMPVFVAYGVGMQWLLDSSVEKCWGLSKHGWITLATVAFILLSGLAKFLILRQTYEQKKMSTGRVLKKLLLGDGYLRIVGAMLPTLFVLIVFFVQAGQSHHIVGLIGLLAGTIYILIPLVWPLFEISSVGVFVLLLSGISLFVFPAYPFYKVAVIFGGLSLGVGIGFRGKHSEGEGDE